MGKWRYFEDNEKVGGLTVLRRTLKPKPQSPDGGGTWYEIRYDCCRDTTVLTHNQISKRKEENRFLCVPCVRERQKKTLRKFNSQRRANSNRHKATIIHGQAFWPSPIQAGTTK